MPDPVFRLMLRGLVDRAGGFDAAAAVIAAATGAFSKGTLSKMCTGQAAVTLDALVALENALGVYPLTARLFERIGAEPREAGDLRALTGRLAADAGSAVSDLVNAFSAVSVDPERLTEDERAQVIVDLRRLRADCEAGLAALEDGPAPVPLRGRGAA